MDTNYLLIWFIAISAVSTLYVALKNSYAHNWGWIAVSLIVLAATFGTLMTAPAQAGYIGCGFWLVLILLPVMGHRRINLLVSRQQFGKAYSLARVLRWLHPAATLISA